MKKAVLILIALLMILSSCAARDISNNSQESPVILSELAKELSEVYADLVFDNETHFDKMKISNVIEIDEKLCVPFQSYPYSLIPYLEEVKDDIEHLYIRQNGDTVYAAAKIKYESKQHYVIVFIQSHNVMKHTYFECRDGVLVHNKLPDIYDFGEVRIGVTTFENILKMDETAFIYKGTYGSKHRLKDGRILNIWYKNTETEVIDKDYIVMGMRIDEDKYNFLDKLLPIDREAIT